MTVMNPYYASLMMMSDNAFGKTGVLDKYGNVLGIVLLVFGLIMLSAALKVRKMGSFYLEAFNNEPVILDKGFKPFTAEIKDHRTQEFGSMKLSEMLVEFSLDGEVYSKWTPDLGFEGTVNIEFNPDDPSDFYITDKIESPVEEESTNITEDGEVVEEDTSKPVNKAFIGMLGLAVFLMGIGIAFLYDFYFIK